MQKVLTSYHLMSCLSCECVWPDAPGQCGKHYGGCPSCGSLYWIDTGPMRPPQSVTVEVALA